MVEAPRHGPRPRGSIPPDDTGQDRALASDAQEPHLAGELLPAWRSGSSDQRLRGRLQSLPLSRKHQQSNPRRRLLRTWPDNPTAERKDQTPDHRPTPLAAPTASRITSSTRRARASLKFALLNASKSLTTDTPEGTKACIKKQVIFDTSQLISETHDFVDPA